MNFYSISQHYTNGHIVIIFRYINEILRLITIKETFTKKILFLRLETINLLKEENLTTNEDVRDVRI